MMAHNDDAPISAEAALLRQAASYGMEPVRPGQMVGPVERQPAAPKKRRFASGAGALWVAWILYVLTPAAFMTPQLALILMAISVGLGIKVLHDRVVSPRTGRVMAILVIVLSSLYVLPVWWLNALWGQGI